MRGTNLTSLCVVALSGLFLQTASSPSARAQEQKNSLNDVYRDESHCLIGPEIRNQQDASISCYCRDAIVDACYVWHTYIIGGKDPNLNGTELTLRINASQMCGSQYDVYKAVESDIWKWIGPELVRTYPPDDVLRQLKPDSNGMIHYEYTVVLLQRDSSGHVVKTESFTARDAVPLRLLEKSSKPPLTNPKN